MLDYSYFINYYKLIAKDLSKQQVFDAGPRAIQQINFTVNLDNARNTTMFFVIQEAKEAVLDFSQGTVKFYKNLIYWDKMTQYNNFNVKLSNSQFNKPKSVIKNKSEVILRLSSNMIGNCNHETNFPQ